MSGLIYPGIWGCLQPNVPQVDWVTTALFPVLVPDNLVLPIPALDANSLLRTTAYNPIVRDTFAVALPSISPLSALTVTIAYKSIGFVDSMAVPLPVISALTALNTTIAYKSFSTSEVFSIALPSMNAASSLVVTINYVTTAPTDTMSLGMPAMSPLSVLTTV